MKPIDGRQIAALARAFYERELSGARAEALATMINGHVDAAQRAARDLPMEAEPSLYPLVLDALANEGRK
ncbi:MAG: hypothetical protein AB7P52_00110 [Alphaproteobacteria bacterium]